MAALSPSATSRVGKRPTTTDQEDAGCAGADEDDKRACRMLTSPKYTSSEFLPVPTAVATTLAAAGATDAGGLKGRSDREEAKEEKSCLGRSLPAT